MLLNFIRTNHIVTIFLSPIYNWLVVLTEWVEIEKESERIKAPDEDLTCSPAANAKQESKHNFENAHADDDNLQVLSDPVDRDWKLLVHPLVVEVRKLRIFSQELVGLVSRWVIWLIVGGLVVVVVLSQPQVVLGNGIIHGQHIFLKVIETEHTFKTFSHDNQHD